MNASMLAGMLNIRLFWSKYRIIENMKVILFLF
jgi:hypothetical protein